MRAYALFFSLRVQMVECLCVCLCVCMPRVCHVYELFNTLLYYYYNYYNTFLFIYLFILVLLIENHHTLNQQWVKSIGERFKRHTVIWFLIFAHGIMLSIFIGIMHALIIK